VKRDYNADFREASRDYDLPVESRRSSNLQFLAVVVMAALGYVADHTGSRRTIDWCVGGIGILIAYLLVPTVRRGTIDVGQPGSGERRGAGVYTRSSDPVGFWTLIALGGIVAGALVFGALGELLGLWSF